MKSERRHELQHNELADWLEKTVNRLRPYGNTILGGVVAVTALIMATSLWFRYSQSSAATAWGAYYTAMNTGSVADLETVATNYATKSAGQWAQISAADTHLRIGCETLFSDKIKAKLDLRRAIDDYTKVAAAPSSPELLSRAIFGLGRAHEAQGELDTALADYQKLVDQFPKQALSDEAQRRITILKQTDVRKFYDQFKGFEPKPAEKTLPKLPFDADTLKEPAPAGGTASKPGETKPADAKPQAKTEPKAETQSVEKKPAADKK